MRSRRRQFAVFLLVIFFAPVAVRADVSTETQTQIIVLLQQVIALQQKIIESLQAALSSQGASQPLASASQTLPYAFDAGTPFCTLYAIPSSIQEGQSALLSWSSQHALTASISELGPVPLSDSQPVSPAKTTIYTGTFTGLNGSTVCTATVTVLPVPNGSATSTNVTATSTSAL
ncbi:MAG: hypothetical protein RLZZ416_713, partial [Candidatus Parcubacteria bacterium]